MNKVVIAAVAALLITAGFTCSKNQPATETPAATEATPAEGTATEAAPAEGAAPAEAAPAEGSATEQAPPSN